MESKVSLKSIVIEIICYLYVLLFVYAAVSKVLDFENFQVQLGQSPLLSAFAVWVAWLVPGIELLIALALMIPKCRSVGLLGAFTLMTMFSVYIFIILHYSSFVPCSCGGILEKMTWNVHLVFNIVFVLLAALAIVWHAKKNRKKRISPVLTIPFSVVSGTLAIIALFLFSEDIMQYKNPFIRRYPQHPITLIKSIDLKFNSYYIAGHTQNKLYLGNYTAPLHMIAIGSDLKTRQIIEIAFDPKKIPFKRARIAVRDSVFYLMDGSVPVVFTGSVKNWKVNSRLKGVPYFTLAEPIDSTSILFRSNNSKKASHVFGVYKQNRHPKSSYNPSLLKQQIDGIFDTDGILVFDPKKQRMVYVYYYRNEFIVADKDLTLKYRGHTIDTITQAKIKVAYLNKNTSRKMAAPPLTVNAHAALCENLLLVHSNIQGQFEEEQLWKNAYIMDVYDLKKHRYLLSFAIYKVGDKKLRALYLTASQLYALMDNELVVYQLRTVLKKEITGN